MLLGIFKLSVLDEVRGVECASIEAYMEYGDIRARDDNKEIRQKWKRTTRRGCRLFCIQ